jgi:cation diffusion facilitator family transporter
MHYDQKENAENGERIAALSTWAVFLLMIIKGATGLALGSIALLADAAHSFADIFASLMVYLGLRIARKEPSERFPFGYQKAESLATLLVSSVILSSGIAISYEAYKTIGSSAGIEYPALALLVALGSVLTSFYLFKIKREFGARLKSQALIAGSRQSLVDATASSIVFAGILGTYLHLPSAEVVAGIAVSLFILRIGISLLKESMLVLMDVRPDPSVMKTIEEIAYNFPEVKDIHRVRLRQVGYRIFGEMHIHLDKNVTLEKAHNISMLVEKTAKNKIDALEHIVIHFGPDDDHEEGM